MHNRNPCSPLGFQIARAAVLYTSAGAPYTMYFSGWHSGRSSSSPSGVWMKVFRGTVFLLLAAFMLLLELGCGDQYRPVANPIVGPGGQPQRARKSTRLNSSHLGISYAVFCLK